MLLTLRSVSKCLINNNNNKSNVSLVKRCQMCQLSTYVKCVTCQEMSNVSLVNGCQMFNLSTDVKCVTCQQMSNVSLVNGCQIIANVSPVNRWQMCHLFERLKHQISYCSSQRVIALITCLDLV